MTENEENEDEQTQEVETQEETKVDPQAEAMATVLAKLDALQGELTELRKPKEVVADTPPMELPKEYSPETVKGWMKESLAESLAPVAAQVQANEVARSMQLRDGLIDQLGDISDTSRGELAALAHRQFEGGAATSMDEAVKFASKILGIKKTQASTDDQDARRAGRRGDRNRAPQENAADQSEDDLLNEIFADHELS